LGVTARLWLDGHWAKFRECEEVLCRRRFSLK